MAEKHIKSIFHLTQDFAFLVKELGLPHLTFHGLRFANATLQLSGNQPESGV